MTDIALIISCLWFRRQKLWLWKRQLV